MSEDRYILLNLELCRKFSTENDIATLWHYATFIYLTAGLGWGNKEDLIKQASEFTGLSISAVRKWMPNLTPYTSKHGKNLHILSKRKVAINLGIKKSKANIIFNPEDLKEYKKFKKLIIVQLGLTLQRRFSYAWTDMIKSPRHSLEKSALIDQPVDIPDAKEKVGVALSKMNEFTGLPVSTLHLYTKDVKKAQFNIVNKLTSARYNALYDSLYFLSNPRYKVIFPGSKKSLVFLRQPNKSNYILIVRILSSRLNSTNQTKRSGFGIA